MDSQQVQAVRDRLAKHVGGRTQVLVYLRRPLSFLRSAYKQRLRMGTTTDRFPDFAAKQRSQIDYPALLERWASVFGADAIQARVFESAVQAPDGIVGDYLRLALAKQPMPPAISQWLAEASPTTNASIADSTAQGVRHANQVAGVLNRLGLSEARTRTVRVAMRKAVQKIDQSPLRATVRGLGPLATENELAQVQRLIDGIDYTVLERWLAQDDLSVLLAPA